MPPTLISENLNEIRNFFKRYKAVVAKPINGFSGNNVILLKTFNANKIKKLTDEGLEVMKTIKLQIEPNESNKEYLDTKKIKSNHIFD